MVSYTEIRTVPLQGNLVDYISRSTALNVRSFLAERTSEVNILCFEYADSYRTAEGPIELSSANLYAGPISPPGSQEDVPAFQDMIRAPVRPTREQLLRGLMKKAPTNKLLIE